MTRPSTIGELRASGYSDRSVKEELRANLLAKLGRGEALFPSIVGFDDSVLPALERGVLAGHDLILLGERGQAKTRLIRRIVDLLAEETPAIAGCEVNDHPFRPICAHCRQGGKQLYFTTYKRRCPERDECPSFGPECERASDDGHVKHLVVSSEPLQGENVWTGMQPSEIVRGDWRMQLTRALTRR